MGFGSIQFGGLASGLDTNAIITALLQAESIPIDKLEAQKKGEEQKVSLLGTLNGLIDDLKSKAEAISTPAKFKSFAVSNPDASLANIAVSGTPTAASHSLEVLSLAQVDRISLNGGATPVADPDTALSAGTLSFDYNGSSISVDNSGGTLSLNDVASEINTQGAGEVTASVVNTGTEASPTYELVVAGTLTGADFTLDNVANTIADIGTQDALTSAANAQIVLDGLTIQRSNNEFNDVLTGVSIDVLEAAPGSAITFDVGVDSEAIKGKLQDFADAYNDVIAFANKQNQFTASDDDSESGSTGGPLFGDSILRSVKDRLFTSLFNVDIATVQADTEGYSTLANVGLELQLDGKITINDTVFDEKLAGDLEAFEDLFADTDGTGADTGLADGLIDALESLLDGGETPAGDPLDGLIDARIEGIKSGISIINDRIELLERNLESLETTLVLQFAALEETISGLNAQGDFLAQQLLSG